LAIVGESGSGKSLTLRSILGLLPFGLHVTAGSIVLEGAGDLVAKKERSLRELRGARLGFVPQQPWTALNPMVKIKRAARQVSKAHTEWSRAETDERFAQELRRLEIVDPHAVMESYPSQLSGGTSQRVVLALCFLLSPDVLLLDEPTTALDVTVQREVMDVLAAVCREDDRSVVIVTHDLGLAWNYCDTAVLLHAGRVVEQGEVDAIFGAPEETYTQRLIDSARLQTRMGD
jgi:ABC-type glutathione transport system ATPase component